uniref:G_PROTEIN_RECEP_F1_2 domain-containing protein n=1 Tax=Panagrellus redivivus TaxID=6233 RepID=A0A7E4ZZK2_PANRE
MIYLINAPFLEKETHQFVMVTSIFWVFSLTFYVLAVPVQFVYRYIQIRQIKDVPKRVHASMLFVVLVCSFFLCFLYYMVFRNSELIDAETAEMLVTDPVYMNEIDSIMSTKLEGFWFHLYNTLSICFTLLSLPSFVYQV